MEFTQVIKHRYSCKKFSNRQVEDDETGPLPNHDSRKDLSETVKYL